jgi:hypothetical protein
MGTKAARQRCAEIFEQMPLVGYRDGLGSSELGGWCIGITTIPTPDGKGRASFEPGCHLGHSAIRQDSKAALPFEITDQRAVAMPTAPRPILETHHARWLKWRVGETTKPTQERIWATTQPQDGAETRAWFCPKSQSQSLQPFFEANGSASRALGHRRDGLGKGLWRAGGLLTKEAADLDYQPTSPMAPGQSGQRTLLVAVKA